MSKLFFTLAFAIGLAVVCWIGAGFVDSDLLALAFTGLIGVVYCLGWRAGELRRQTRQLAEMWASTRKPRTGLWLAEHAPAPAISSAKTH